VSRKRQLDELDAHVAQLEGQLVEHERRLAALEGDFATLRRELGACAWNVGRLSNVSTAQGLTLERILRNARRLVEMFEPVSTIESSEESRG
jgi:hypothetical protein